jgi:LysM domain
MFIVAFVTLTPDLLTSDRNNQIPDSLEPGSILLNQPLTGSETALPAISINHSFISTTKIISYTVLSGDNLFSIADAFRLRPVEVLWSNFDTLTDDPTLIKPGMVLFLPPAKGTIIYVWKEGDHLTDIAGQFGVDPIDILKYLGNVTGTEMNTIETFLPAPGTRIIIPGGTPPVIRKTTN